VPSDLQDDPTRKCVQVHRCLHPTPREPALQDHAGHGISRRYAHPPSASSPCWFCGICH
jgi:hypothetical protein